MRKLLRLFKIWHYPRYVKILWFQFRAESPAVYIAQEKQRFQENGLDYEAALKKLNGILQKNQHREFDNRYHSIHWLLFSALSLKYPNATDILEIGTFKGFFSSLLVDLFPSANIVTVDLPESDPILRTSYCRDDAKIYDEFQAIQKKNTSSPRIQPLKLNSLFLSEKIEGRKFDFIWVDGGHVYPEVAVDIANAYMHCKENGFVVCDDVVIEPKGYNDGLVSVETAEMLDYIAKRVHTKVVHFRKRCGTEYSMFFWKYVSIIQKKRYAP